MRFRRRKLFQGEEDIMNLIREFKFEGGDKESKVSVFLEMHLLKPKILSLGQGEERVL